MTYRRCQDCRSFYEKSQGGPCPNCGAKPYAYNPHVAKSKLNSALYAQAESAARNA
jgi:rRNA maturation endonuclease Nob1